MKKWLCTLALLLPTALHADSPPESVRVFMAGDSTMSEKLVEAYPETGWGMPFSHFFERAVLVDNRAMNGRSTRTFIEEGRWDGIVQELKASDFVIIQFGHNDESENKRDRYTTPEEYKANLARFIRETRGRGARPLLMTPVTRRNFDELGKIKYTHPYSPLVREVAAAEKVDFIDMDEITRAYFQSLGDEGSALRFLQIPPDTHPNYPNGVRDNTHFNQLGGLEVAQLVLKELKRMEHPLASRLRRAREKHLTYSY